MSGCGACGFEIDTPNHELGCEFGRMADEPPTFSIELRVTLDAISNAVDEIRHAYTRGRQMSEAQRIINLGSRLKERL